MARTESVAVAGYYPTPGEQIPRIAGMLSVPPLCIPDERPGYGGRHQRQLAVLDPCAGDGAALRAIVQRLLVEETKDTRQVTFYTCELEATRLKALREGFSDWVTRDKRALGGDAFLVTWKPVGSDWRAHSKGVGLLYLNPPYDTDKVFGRLEERFLARFTLALAAGGVLAYVVPHYALAASAETLGKMYEDLSCYRFAGEGFDVYKQVVLFAKRRSVDLYEADAEILAKVSAWATDGSTIPELPEEGTVAAYSVPVVESSDALDGWKMNEVDVSALLEKFSPWHETTRARGLTPIARILPDLPVVELMHRTYEVATPPRPAHIAAGIAAGIFNGQRIEPDDPKKLPPLLVKGVFDREWRTIEEKKNKDGETTGEVQVQQPKLVVTVLDLDAHQYHTVKSSIEASKGIPDVADMGVADLLKHYGQALMGVMEKQCEILYDPRTDAGKVELPDSPRKLYTAQAHAVRGCVKLLRDRPGRQPILLGEIGSGKSGVALLTGKSIGAKCTLVVCPPHLLQSWENEVKAVMPEAIFTTIESLTDLEGIGETTVDEPVIAVLSRETAKLGHAWEGVGDTCPKCGLPTGTSAEEQAKKRLCCEGKTLSPLNDYAHFAHRMALKIRAYKRSGVVRNILRGRLDHEWGKRLSVGEEGEAGAARESQYRGLPLDLVQELRIKLAWGYFVQHMDGEEAKQAMVWLYMAAPDPEYLLKLMPLVKDDRTWHAFIEELPLLLKPGSLEMAAAENLLALLPPPHYGGGAPLAKFKVDIEAIEEKKYPVQVQECGAVSWEDGKLHLDGVEAGSLQAATRALEALTKLATWTWTKECGEQLFQASPSPRRVPLSKYIVRRHKHLFDFMVLDEGHEFANGDSAQGLAAHRLCTLKLPTVFMTGSVMNGYATSLFANLWALSPEFRDEFERGDLVAFNDRYGYRKRFVQDKVEGEVISFGSQTDRVERSARDVGNAPGVLPLFLFRHLLPSAVTIHKADLRIDLPPCSIEPSPIDPGEKLLAEYTRLLRALRDQIKEDRYDEDGKAGKLFGALAELPSYLDRATVDVGNIEGGGAYEIRYPESVGGELIATADMFQASFILPKEKRLLDKVEAELAEGRNVMVFGWHLSILPRLQRLIEARTGERAPILWADKVPTHKRQAWIEREIVKKNARVMIANPVAIQTGLNNLVHFATEIWHENPACNPIVYRQAIGRIDRIGQKLPTRIFFPYYEGTLQEQLRELLLAKVAISTATDGLDPESALRAAGIVEDEFLTGLSIGKQLWSMFLEEDEDERPRKRLGRKR